MSPVAPVDPKRSRVMAAIRSRNTRPERLVRRLAHGLGFRFRLHRRDLPGSPDLVFPRFRSVVFVHGCFWHRHTCTAGCKQPATNRAYWRAKFKRNKQRDVENKRALRQVGWRVLVVWECQLRHPESVKRRLLAFLAHDKPPARRHSPPPAPAGPARGPTQNQIPYRLSDSSIGEYPWAFSSARGIRYNARKESLKETER